MSDDDKKPNVIPLTVHTNNKIDEPEEEESMVEIANNALEAAKDQFSHVIIMGYSEDGTRNLATTLPHFSDINWLIDKIKQDLIDIDNNMEMEED